MSAEDPVPRWLWEWYGRQDRYTIDQFGLGVVGIGALFFAYAQSKFEYLKILIALIGLGGSVVLWSHMHGTRMEKRAVEAQLRELVPSFAGPWDAVQNWREESWFNQLLYFSSGRLMMYFMAMMS